MDLVEIEAQLPDDFFLVIDDRKANMRFLREHFRRRYAFSPRARQAQPVFRLLK